MGNTVEDQLLKCKEDLEFYKSLTDTYQLLSVSIQDEPFKVTDLQLSEKYFFNKEPLLEKAIYSYLECHAKLIEQHVLEHNSIDIYLPSVESLPDLFSYLTSLDKEELNCIKTEYFKFVILSHHFKIKQLVASLFPLMALQQNLWVPSGSGRFPSV